MKTKSFSGCNEKNKLFKCFKLFNEKGKKKWNAQSKNVDEQRTQHLDFVGLKIFQAS